MSTSRPLEQLKVAELKEELKKRGLSLKGIKKDLFERLDEAIRKEQAELQAQSQFAEIQAQSHFAEIQAQSHVAGIQAQSHAVYGYSGKAGYEPMDEQPSVHFKNINQPPHEIYTTPPAYHYGATAGNPEMSMDKEKIISSTGVQQVLKNDDVQQVVKNDDFEQVPINSNVQGISVTPEPEYSVPDPDPAPAPVTDGSLIEADPKPDEHQDIQNPNVTDVATEQAADVQPVSDDPAYPNVTDVATEQAASVQPVSDDPAPNVTGNTIEEPVVPDVVNNVDVREATIGNDVSPAVLESVNRCEGPVSENLVSDDNVNKPVLENVVSQSETVMQDVESSEKSNLTGLNVCTHSEEIQDNSRPAPNIPTEQEDLSVGNDEAGAISNVNEKITEPSSMEVQIPNENYPAVQDVEDVSEKTNPSIEQSAQKENLVAVSNVPEIPHEDSTKAMPEVPEIPHEDSTKPVDVSGNQGDSETVKQNDRMDVDNESKVLSTGEEKVLENESISDVAPKPSTESPDFRPSEDDSSHHTGQKRKEDENKSVEPVKRVRRWNSNNQMSAESAKPLTTETIKEITESAKSLATESNDSKTVSPKPSSRLTATTKSVTVSNKVNSEANGNKRTVPPPTHAPTTSLKIERFVRPFTLKAVKDMLSLYGEFNDFWMDQIKTHCYITYKSVEQAIAARNGLYDTQWPPTVGNKLIAEFVESDEVKKRVEVILEKPMTVNQTQAPVNQVPSSQGPSVTPAAVHGHQNRIPLPVREKEVPVPKKEAEPQVPTLDDLFFKTKAKPHIYYLPLSDEQVAARRSKEQSKHLSRA